MKWYGLMTRKEHQVGIRYCQANSTMISYFLCLKSRARKSFASVFLSGTPLTSSPAPSASQAIRKPLIWAKSSLLGLYLFWLNRPVRAGFLGAPGSLSSSCWLQNCPPFFGEAGSLSWLLCSQLDTTPALFLESLSVPFWPQLLEGLFPEGLNPVKPGASSDFGCWSSVTSGIFRPV